MLDRKRVTEDGAEYLALLLVGKHCSWQTIRRLQSQDREGADWLMADTASGEELVL